MSYSIGQLARTAETGVETIRFYERRGLMPEPPRTSSGYRRYPLDAAERLRFIQRAKRLGFTLDEIGSLLRLEAGGDRAEVKKIALAKLGEIETRIADLERMRATLCELTQRCSGHGPVAGCPIIDALAEETNDHA
ncbi:MerR family transcriptional regulator [Spectribacter hydrogenooxidans]|uniref:Mercuric resistance operon regulatory protein n=1 Tax=Spectribacter hydrogenoxidans TaxID=3075608 RepID=A0ABU3C3F8_9GAMM|nr:MerR family DNA-binding protein [Salinisphaera sp. W335]MDT0636104.1 MerR family DNA-binding protein [Salinisphaera sp. W335]